MHGILYGYVVKLFFLQSTELVDLFFEDLRSALGSGEQVKLSGFGNFDLRDKNERPGRNPKTGEEVPISPRRVLTFRPSHLMKERVAEGNKGLGAALETKPSADSKESRMSRLRTKRRFIIT